jgi:hypothetical protein
MKNFRRTASLFSVLLAALAAPAAVAPEESRLLDTIRAGLLEAHVSFLASDALEGATRLRAAWMPRPSTSPASSAGSG